MAEGTCRSCGGVVAAGATACPHCGVPDPVTGPPGETTSPTPGATTSPTPATTVEPTRPTSAEPTRPPSAESRPTTPAAGPDPAREEAAPGSRLTNALKAIGCLAIAGIVLLIAIMVGLFDVFF